MSKTVLGRRLGHLLNGTKPVHPPAQTDLALAEPAPEGISPGLGTLLRGASQGQSARPSDRQIQPSGGRRAGGRSLRWSLWAADGVLLLLAGGLVFRRSAPLTWLEVALCVLAVGLGAWLACCAVWWHAEG